MFLHSGDRCHFLKHPKSCSITVREEKNWNNIVVYLYQIGTNGKAVVSAQYCRSRGTSGMMVLEGIGELYSVRETVVWISLCTNTSPDSMCRDPVMWYFYCLVLMPQKFWQIPEGTGVTVWAVMEWPSLEGEEKVWVCKPQALYYLEEPRIRGIQSYRNSAWDIVVIAGEKPEDMQNTKHNKMTNHIAGR